MREVLTNAQRQQRFRIKRDAAIKLLYERIIKMQMKMFTVFDSKAEAYLKPFFAQSIGVAVRMFTEVCNDGKSEFSKYPADYTLFELGSWDELTAKFELLPTPRSLGVAVEFVNKSLD